MENENTRFNIYKNKSYFFRQPEIKMVHIQIIINFLNLCFYSFSLFILGKYESLC